MIFFNYSEAFCSKYFLEDKLPKACQRTTIFFYFLIYSESQREK